MCCQHGRRRCPNDGKRTEKLSQWVRTSMTEIWQLWQSHSSCHFKMFHLHGGALTCLKMEGVLLSLPRKRIANSFHQIGFCMTQHVSFCNWVNEWAFTTGWTGTGYDIWRHGAQHNGEWFCFCTQPFFFSHVQNFALEWQKKVSTFHQCTILGACCSSCFVSPFCDPSAFKQTKKNCTKIALRTGEGNTNKNINMHRRRKIVKVQFVWRG